MRAVVYQEPFKVTVEDVDDARIEDPTTGKLFEKGLRIGTGQANVTSYHRHLRDLIIAGRAKPSFVVSKELPLEDAADAYARFDKREEGYSKVVLEPGS